MTYPQVLSHTSLPYLKRQPFYYGAKYMGDLLQGVQLCDELIKEAVIYKIQEIADANKVNVYMVPVMQREGYCFNMIPLAYAMCLRKFLGFPIVKSIQRISGKPNTSKSLAERKQNSLSFGGLIPEKGVCYVLVDDHFTTGATLRELANHIIRQGGEILAVTALSCGRFGRSFIHTYQGQFIGMTGVEYQALRLYNKNFKPGIP